MRSLALRLLTLLLVLAGPLLADPPERVTHSFVQTNLPDALRVLAQKVNRNIYVAPDVQGIVTLELDDVPAAEAFRRLLDWHQGFDFRFLDGPSTRTVVVARPDILVELIDNPCCRMRPVLTIPARVEYLLEEETPVADTLEFLKAQYPDVEFTPHPKLNGFYAEGSRENLLQIKRELTILERR